MKRIIPLFFLILLLVTGCDESASVHEVVFDDSYGTTFTQDVYDGKTVVKPYKNPSAPVEAKKGKFKEWIIKSESGAETVYDFSQPVKRDLYLYATYYDLYTVYFLNGTSLFSTAEVSEGDKVEKPSSSPVDPAMGALEGWARDPERPRETSYDFNTPVTSSFNLYAYYREAKYVTLLDPDGKQIGERIKVDYEDLLPVPDVKECGEKLIEKWQVKRGDNWEDYDFSLPVETDLTLRAVCYDTIPNKDKTLTTEEVLSVMRFAEILASMSGFEKGDGTTSGFKNTDLIKLFLAGSNGVDPETLNFRYPNNGTYYELYIPGESLNVPENILYYEITRETKAGRYNRGCEDGTTKIEADDFSIIVNLAKGKIENGSVVKEGDFFDKTSISLTLKSVDLTMDEGGNIEIKYWEGSRYYVFTMANEHTDKSTVSTLVLNKTGSGEQDSGSGAVKMTFYTITFDPDNGEDVRSVKRIASSDGAAVSKPDSDPLDSELNPTFRFWTKNGVEYDFSSKITENTVLKARYFTHEDYYNKILVAECIYKIPTLLSKYDKLYNGENIFSKIFPNDVSTDHDLAEILLSAVFSIAPGSEKLYVTYNGDKYDYEDNTGSYTIIRLDQIKIDVNKSSKDGNTEKIKIDNFLLALQYKYTTNPEALWATVKETFSIDATIVTGDKGTKVTTAALKAGGKTYSTLTATTTTLSDGTNEVVFEYEGVRFKRTY